MSIGAPAGDKFVMGIFLVEIFRVRKAGLVKANLAKRSGVSTSWWLRY